MFRVIKPTVLTALAALTVSATAANAAPAVKTVPVKMSDQRLDSVVAGGGMNEGHSWGLRVTCSFGNNCSGNGGNGNGNTHGFLNLLNGNFAGSAIASGDAVYVVLP